MLTPTPSHPAARRTLAVIALTALVGLVVSACGGATGSTGMPDAHRARTAPSASTPDGMPGMADMPTGDGLAAEASGFRFAPATSSLPGSQPATFQFRITGTDGKPVTTFEPDQTKLMHFYLIVPGAATATPLPAASASTQVDGYTLTLSGDQIMAGMEHTLTVTVSKDGHPVTDLQPYLDTYAHLTAFHHNDLAFAHLHPHGTVNGNHAGPTLSFEATLPKAGNWRLFLQFHTVGVLHTAAVTLSVG